MNAIAETAEEQAKRLTKFQDETFRIIDHYIAHYVSPKEFGVLRELRKELWELKLKLFEEQHPL